MKAPWKIIKLELSQEISLPILPDNYQGILFFFCWQGIPLGTKEVSASELPMTSSQILNLAIKEIAPALGSQLLESGFAGKLPVDSSRRLTQDTINFAQLQQLKQPLHTLQTKWQSISKVEVSVIVCTRNRPEQLKKCLRSLAQLNPTPSEIVVVDNAPNSDATKEIVSQFSQVKYILEPKPGLSIARNTGIQHSRGAIVAFTDDDLEVHPQWILGLQQGFKTPQVMAVTGLMLPAELETEAQIFFYQGSNSSRWEYQHLIFDRQFFAAMRSKGVPVWRIGAGANMAFRRRVFELVGNFNEILGAGASGCSEDSEMWYRILAAGWQCRYEPTAVIFHYHRRNLENLQQQMYQYMRGHVTALLVQFQNHRHWGNLRRILIALPRYYLQRAYRKYLRGNHRHNQTLEAEIKGYLSGIVYFWQHQNSIGGKSNVKLR